MNLVKLTINSREVEVQSGTTILKAAEKIGIDIPRLCYDDDLSPVGACRLCMVEVKGARSLVPACVTAVSPGMVVETESPVVIESRRTTLNLLISNHPLDCLICEKLGDCGLAEYCYKYGVKESTFQGERHDYVIEENNSFIIRDLNKCIQCGKCIRACDEWTGIHNLDFIYRGFDVKPATALDSTYVDSECVFCGNCVTVCPTGALTEKQMKRQGRRWEVQKVKTTCPFCGTGCNFDLNVKDGRITGVTANRTSIVNGRALCVKGHYGWDFVQNEKRLTTPLIKKDGEFMPATWDEALDLIANRLKGIKEQYGPDAFAALSSARCTNEENYLVQKFTRAVMGTNSVDHCART